MPDACVQFLAPDYGRKTRLEHVQRLTEINILKKIASCWLTLSTVYILAMHGPMNVTNSVLCSGGYYHNPFIDPA